MVLGKLVAAIPTKERSRPFGDVFLKRLGVGTWLLFSQLRIWCVRFRQAARLETRPTSRSSAIAEGVSGGVRYMGAACEKTLYGGEVLDCRSAYMWVGCLTTAGFIPRSYNGSMPLKREKVGGGFDAASR